jgi:8-oxo-dGTP diphosphatase
VTRLVVGGVLVDSFTHPTRVLAARRTRPASLAGRWEFPGGKVDAGETPRDALVRELAEELRVEVEAGDPLGNTWSIDSDLELRLYFCSITDGDLTPGETHDEVRWLTVDTLESVDWLPADVQVLPALRRVLSR